MKNLNDPFMNFLFARLFEPDDNQAEMVFISVHRKTFIGGNKNSLFDLSLFPKKFVFHALVACLANIRYIPSVFCKTFDRNFRDVFINQDLHANSSCASNVENCSSANEAA